MLRRSVPFHLPAVRRFVSSSSTSLCSVSRCSSAAAPPTSYSTNHFSSIQSSIGLNQQRYARFGSVALDDKDKVASNQVTTTESLKLALSFAWPKGQPEMKLRVVLSIMCVGAAKLLAVCVPFIFKRIVDALTAQTSLVVTTTPATTAGGAATTTSQIVAVATTVPVMEPTVFGTAITIGIGSLIVAYIGTRIVAALTNELRHAVFARVSAHIYQQVIDVSVQHLQQLDMHFHVQKQSGAVLRTVERGCQAVTSLSLYTLLVLLPTGVEFALVVGLLSAQVGWEAAIISVGAVALYVMWTAKITKWRMKFRDEAIGLETKRGTLVSDSLLNYETVAYCGGVRHEARRVHAINKKLNRASVNIDQSMALLNVGQQLVFCAAGAASIGLAANGVLLGTMTVGDLVLVDSLLLQLYVPLSWLGIVLREVVTNGQNFRELAALLKENSTMSPTTTGEPPKPMVCKKGTIELRNVNFTTGERLVLKNVSLTIPGGSFVGFVGPSGTGKSTVLRLIFRFFDVDGNSSKDGEQQGGAVLIDGQDVRDVTLESLRRRFAVIPQDTVLFNETVRYNIAYGRAGVAEEEYHRKQQQQVKTAAAATAVDGEDPPKLEELVGQEEIERAAQHAQIHDALMERFPEGYDTVVGERGLKLSGGEKQRIAIARALLKDADIVLADEATSALDSMTEAEVVKKLRFHSAGADGVGSSGSSSSKRPRTLICVAHRLTTLKDCDCIFVLNTDGGLEEQGTHDELVAKKDGLYAQLWLKQQKKHDDDDDEDDAADGEGDASVSASATTTTPGAA